MVTTTVKKPKKNKAPLNSTVSPWIKKRIDEMANTEDFASVSDIVSQALSEFIGRYDAIKERERLTRESVSPTVEKDTVAFIAEGR